MSDLARYERGAALQRAVVGSLNVVGVVLCRPPTDHPRRRRRTTPALAGKTGVVDVGDIRTIERHIKDFGFVDSFGARQRGTQRLSCEMTLRDGAIVYDLNGLSRPDWTTAPESKKGKQKAKE